MVDCLPSMPKALVWNFLKHLPRYVLQKKIIITKNEKQLPKGNSCRSQMCDGLGQKTACPYKHWMLAWIF